MGAGLWVMDLDDAKGSARSLQPQDIHSPGLWEAIQRDGACSRSVASLTPTRLVLTSTGDDVGSAGYTALKWLEPLFGSFWPATAKRTPTSRAVGRVRPTRPSPSEAVSRPTCWPTS